MLYEFLLTYVETFTFLNVFKYITFRTGLAFFTSLFIALLIGGPFIKLFSNKKIFNPIREDGPSDHIVKKIGTPTMGGIIILIGIIFSVILWADLSNIYILFCLYIVASFGLLGAFFGTLQSDLEWPHFASRSSGTSHSIGFFIALNLKTEKKSFRNFKPVES